MASSMISRVKWEHDQAEEKDGVIQGKTSLVFNAIDRHFAAKRGEHETVVTWEGSFWECTEDVHDFAEFPIEVLECVTRKIARVLRERITASSDQLLLLLPNVIQLPLVVLAADRLGIVPVVVNPVGLSVERLSALLGHTQPSLVITLDGFFQGTQLVESKKLLDEAVAQSGISCLREVLVVGHVGARAGVPLPTSEYPGRRPNYSVKIPMSEGRDAEWSKVISGVAQDVDEHEIVWRQLDAPLLQYPQWTGTELSLAAVALGTLLQWTDTLATELGTGPTLVISTRNDGVFVLVGVLAALVAGKASVFFEGSLEYPDPARLSFMIAKYEVESLLVDSLASIDKEYAGLKGTPSLARILTREDTEVYLAADHRVLDLAY